MTPPTERSVEEAEEAVARFLRVVDQLSSDPHASVQKLNTVARGKVFDQWVLNINQYRYKGWKQTGNEVVREASAKPLKGGRHRVTACIDVSKVNLIDKKGNSVVAANRPPRVSYDYILERDEGKWYVVQEKVTGTC